MTLPHPAPERIARPAILWRTRLTERRGIVALGVVATVVALWFAVREVDVDETRRILTNASPGWLALALYAISIQTYVRAVRWSRLLPGSKRIGPTRTLPVLLVGYLGNTVLPARLGEVIRAATLARREGLPTTEVFGSVALERILDTLTLALFGLVASFLAGLPAQVAVVASIGVLLAVAAVLLLIAAPRGLSLVRVAALDRIIVPVRAVIRGADILSRPRAIAIAVGLCAIAWILDAGMWWIIARAIGIELSPVGAVSLSAVAALSSAIPSAPGYLGTFEVVVTLAARALGVAAPAALALAIAVHAIAMLPLALAGGAAAVAMSRAPRGSRTEFQPEPLPAGRP